MDPAIKEYFDSKFAALNAAKKNIYHQKPITLQSKGNQNQLDHANEVLLAIKLAEEYILDGDQENALEKIGAAKKSLEKRIKHIRLADKSPNGWNFIAEYVADDLASDSEDEKRIKRAESEATKKRKFFLEQAARKRSKPESQLPSTSSTTGKQFFRGPAGPSRKSFRYEDRCFACGQEGHWRTNCPGLPGSKRSTFKSIDKE